MRTSFLMAEANSGQVSGLRGQPHFDFDLDFDLDFAFDFEL
jgi:hypothetical protein